MVLIHLIMVAEAAEAMAWEAATMVMVALVVLVL